MSQQEYKQAKSWANVISPATQICFDARPGYDDTDFFASVSQALKAKLDRTTQKSLNDEPGVLEALTTPFFQETSFAFDVKKEVADKEPGERGKKLKTIWEFGGYKKTQPIYTALQDLISKNPADDRLQALSDDIEALATELPDDLKVQFGLSDDEGIDSVCALVKAAENIEPVS